ncbi:UNVERIFIED_CONTAM: hypothetical protein NCL1_42444 [Trichonephila clavipes]
MEDRVKAGKINCDEFPKLCQLASVHAYPTVMFYEGKKDGHSQDSLGIEIHGLTFDGIYSFLEAVLKRKSQILRIASKKQGSFSMSLLNYEELFGK